MGERGNGEAVPCSLTAQLGPTSSQRPPLPLRFLAQGLLHSNPVPCRLSPNVGEKRASTHWGNSQITREETLWINASASCLFA